jgi:hypothetical protein
MSSNINPLQLVLTTTMLSRSSSFSFFFCLSGVKPIGNSWDKEVKDWFDQHVNRKVLYAVVEKEKPFQAGLPPKLVVQLIDTSYGEDDLILSDHMIQTNMAAKE